MDRLHPTRACPGCYAHLNAALVGPPGSAVTHWMVVGGGVGVVRAVHRVVVGWTVVSLQSTTTHTSSWLAVGVASLVGWVSVG